MPVPVTFLGAASGEIGFGLLQNAVVTDWNAKTLYRARSWQPVDAEEGEQIQLPDASGVRREKCFSGDHSSKASHRLRKTLINCSATPPSGILIDAQELPAARMATLNDCSSWAWQI
ncbi:hypothetical protein [Phyllobacterium sp. LjRoot231]|uniref:hypothetical protein n=1 Tax=Phyllobacterium sp. LjRoot231 TaxID=3342289 RepID=UPI003F4F9A61